MTNNNNTKNTLGSIFLNNDNLNIDINKDNNTNTKNEQYRINSAFNNYSDIQQLRKELKIKPKTNTKKQLSIETLMLSEIGIIYFISDIGNVWVRIGKTKNLLNLYERFRKHQGGSPIQLKLDGIIVNDDYHKLDKQLRKQFDLYHSHSDWFIYAKEIKNYVTDNCLDISYNNSYFNNRVENELY